jgi:hypothetical protein
MEHLERARLPATRHRAPCAPQPAAAQPERTPARSSAVLAAPQLTTLAAWGGLQAPGSGLRAPGSRLHYVRYVSCRRHHPVLLGRAPQALGSWPCHALRTSRSATEGPVGGCGAALGPGQRRRLCGVPPPGPRLRVQQHAFASPQTQAKYLDLGDGLTKCCREQGCFRCGMSSTVPVTTPAYTVSKSVR